MRGVRTRKPAEPNAANRRRRNACARISDKPQTNKNLNCRGVAECRCCNHLEDAVGKNQRHRRGGGERNGVEQVRSRRRNKPR